MIEVTENEPSFPNISLENNLTAGALTSHLIDVHNARRICYLGSRSEELYSKRREKAFISVMQQRALSVADADIYSCDETPEDYIRALQYFNAADAPSSDVTILPRDRISPLRLLP